VKHSFLLDNEEPTLLSTHFDALSRLAALPVYQRLDYPRDYERLPQVRQVALDSLPALRAAHAP
jgi:hypothetical protein